MDNFKQYNINKNLNTPYLRTLFCMWQIFFGVLVPFLSGLVLFNLLINISLINGFFLRLILHLSIVIFLGGFWVIWIIFWAMWDESFIVKQCEKYDSAPANLYSTLEIILPEGFDYDTESIISYFFFIKNTFRSVDSTFSNMLNYGKFDRTLTFDFVIKDKKLAIYATIARKQYTQFIEGMIRFFPGLVIGVVDNPYASWPSSWQEGCRVESNTEFAGYSFGLRIDGFHPFHKRNSLPKEAEWSSLDNFLRSAKESLNKNEILIFQYVFMASNSGLPNEKYKSDYNKWRQKLYDSYSPKRDGYTEGEVLGTLLPEEDVQINHSYHYRSQQPLLQTAIKVGAFCTVDRIDYLENLIEKLGNIFSGDNCRVGKQCPEKKHITATNQKYFRHDNKASEFQYVYDRYVFPSKNVNILLDRLFGPLYEKYYFPNENRYRKQANYKSLIYRRINGPWSGFRFYVDPISATGLFQLPVSTYNSNYSFKKEVQNYL